MQEISPETNKSYWRSDYTLLWIVTDRNCNGNKNVHNNDKTGKRQPNHKKYFHWNEFMSATALMLQYFNCASSLIVAKNAQTKRMSQEWKQSNRLVSVASKSHWLWLLLLWSLFSPFFLFMFHHYHNGRS